MPQDKHSHILNKDYVILCGMVVDNRSLDGNTVAVVDSATVDGSGEP